MTAQRSTPVRAVRLPGRRGEADYVMLRYTPDIAWEATPRQPGQVVVVVDTSAGGDEADRQLRNDAAEAILRALSTADRFALVAADLTPRLLYPDRGLAPADEASIGKALERLSAVRSAGASDLGAIFDVALSRLHGASQGAVVYVGDGAPTSGELDGDALAARLARSMGGTRARLFTLGVGAGANHGLLGRLAEVGGGRAVRIDLPEQVVQEALTVVGLLKTPTLTDLKLDVGAGLDQVFSSVAGKVSRGQEVTILARTHHVLPREVQVTGQLGGKPFVRRYPMTVESGAAHAYVPGLWGRRYLAQLLGVDRDRNRGAIIRLGLDYGLMTPFTSFLVLESDEAYHQQGIERRRRDPLWGARSALLEGIAAAPLALFGCAPPESKSLSLDTFNTDNRSVRYLIRAPEQRADEVPRWLARPVHKGEEGKMGSGRLAGKRGSAASIFGKSAGGGSDADDAVGGLIGNQVGEPYGVGEPGDRLHDAYGLGGLGGARGGRGAPARLTEESARSAGVLGLLKKTEPSVLGLLKEEPPATSGVLDGTRALVPAAGTCSDASRRTLAQRRVIWSNLLQQATGTAEALGVYRRARLQCELRSWRDHQELLGLIQEKARTASDAAALIGALPDPHAREHVRKLLLRRALADDSHLGIDWGVIDAALSRARDPERRAVELRAICARHPRSMDCVMRLARLDAAAGRTGEALALLWRARQNGMVSPALLQLLGELLARSGQAEDARRIFSEIVEFAPEDVTARRLVGDLYLRHGWYGEAYRQYSTLVDQRPGDRLALLRLAAAAAGAGRVDEALRLERRVAAADGDPGPSDPRHWARLWSAVRLARLIADARTSSESMRQGVERSLRRLQVLPASGTLVLLTWEDLEARLDLRLERQGQPAPVLGGSSSGAPVGLIAVSTSAAAPTVAAAVERRTPRTRALSFELTTISWDGLHLIAKRQRGVMATGADAARLPLGTSLARR
jgi:tetratricopeptide (TPR) repeat protein